MRSWEEEIIESKVEEGRKSSSADEQSVGQ
jgi:hypothetical protein